MLEIVDDAGARAADPGGAATSCASVDLAASGGSVVDDHE